jgi:translation initiation factor IF-2
VRSSRSTGARGPGSTVSRDRVEGQRGPGHAACPGDHAVTGSRGAPDRGCDHRRTDHLAPGRAQRPGRLGQRRPRSSRRRPRRPLAGPARDARAARAPARLAARPAVSSPAWSATAGSAAAAGRAEAPWARCGPRPGPAAARGPARGRGPPPARTAPAPGRSRAVAAAAAPRRPALRPAVPARPQPTVLLVREQGRPGRPVVGRRGRQQRQPGRARRGPVQPRAVEGGGARRAEQPARGGAAHAVPREDEVDQVGEHGPSVRRPAARRSGARAAVDGSAAVDGPAAADGQPTARRAGGRQADRRGTANAPPPRPVRAQPG